MVQDNTQKAGRAMVEALADSRYNPNAFINYVISYADTNDAIQGNLWQTFVAYAYDRQMVNDYGLAYTQVQQYIGTRCSTIVHDVIDIEYNVAKSPDIRRIPKENEMAVDLKAFDE
jgi:hypothetical protein